MMSSNESGGVPMRTVLLWFGLSGLSSTELSIVLALAFTAAVFAGWLADTIMEEMGFGISINAIILLIGGLVGLWLWARLGYSIGKGQVVMSIIACTASAIFALLTTSIIRRYF
jgi:uncharacterized membrane protein YeaQ/YmgE (transglycosylase-associated protein family)